MIIFDLSHYNYRLLCDICVRVYVHPTRGGTSWYVAGVLFSATDAIIWWPMTPLFGTGERTLRQYLGRGLSVLGGVRMSYVCCNN